MKRIKITIEDKREKLLEVLKNIFPNEDLTLLHTEDLVDRYNQVGINKFLKNNHVIIHNVNEGKMPKEIWTKEQAQDLDNRFEKFGIKLKNEIKTELKAEFDPKFDAINETLKMIVNKIDALGNKLDDHVNKFNEHIKNHK